MTERLDPAVLPEQGLDATVVYTLGSSEGETARLQRQADELAPDNSALLDRVGLRPGQSVIDLGCGPRGILDLLAEAGARWPGLPSRRPSAGAGPRRAQRAALISIYGSIRQCSA